MCGVFFNDTATTEIYTLSLHDALPIWVAQDRLGFGRCEPRGRQRGAGLQARDLPRHPRDGQGDGRSEEHTSELQSRQYLVCRLLLEKNNRQASTAAPLPRTIILSCHSP